MPLRAANRCFVNIITEKNAEPKKRNDSNRINPEDIQDESVNYKTVKDNELYQKALKQLQHEKQQIEDATAEANNLSDAQTGFLQQAFAINLNKNLMHGNIGFFYKNLRSLINALLYDAIPDEKIKQLDGNTALIKITYSEEGDIENISVISETNSGFADMLSNNKVQWHSVPAPLKYNLPYKVLNLRISIKEGSPSVGIEVI